MRGVVAGGSCSSVVEHLAWKAKGPVGFDFWQLHLSFLLFYHFRGPSDSNGKIRSLVRPRLISLWNW